MIVKFLCLFLLLSTASAAQAADPEQFPLLTNLQENNPLFRQLRADIEQAYRRNEASPPLILYRYVPQEGETLFSISARLLLPYSSIASLNSIHSSRTDINSMNLLIPNQPGIFSPADSETERSTSPVTIILPDPRSGNTVWNYFPGEDFSPAERSRFFDSRFSFPVDAPRVTSGYGMRISPITNMELMHHGVDFGGRSGNPVLAAASGRISAISWNPVLGYYVEIDHDSGITSLYGHLAQITVNFGQQVNRAETIGKMGTTGLTTGPHVHFEIRQEGIPVDPFLYLPKIEVK